MGIITGEKGSSRRAANGTLAMSIGKKHSTLGQSINVRRASLRVTTQATDPVVEIIDSDEEHIDLSGDPKAKGSREA